MPRSSRSVASRRPTSRASSRAASVKPDRTSRGTTRPRSASRATRGATPAATHSADRPTGTSTSRCSGRSRSGRAASSSVPSPPTCSTTRSGATRSPASPTRTSCASGRSPATRGASSSACASRSSSSDVSPRGVTFAPVAERLPGLFTCPSTLILKAWQINGIGSGCRAGRSRSTATTASLQPAGRPRRRRNVPGELEGGFGDGRPERAVVRPDGSSASRATRGATRAATRSADPSNWNLDFSLFKAFPIGAAASSSVRSRPTCSTTRSGPTRSPALTTRPELHAYPGARPQPAAHPARPALRVLR